MKRFSFAVVFIVLACSALAAGAAKSADASFTELAVRLRRPAKVGVIAADKSKLVGQVIWFDAMGFELVDGKDLERVVRWTELSAQSAYEIYEKILGKNGEEWVQAGWVLRSLPGGAQVSDRAFARALNLNAKLQPQIEQAKSAIAPSGEPGKNLLPGWTHPTEAQQSKAVAELKSTIANSPETKSLKLYETKYFLFYTDLKPEEGARWASLLDKMYARLAEMFAVDSGKNIWDGKAVVIVFRKADEFRNYEKKVYKKDAKDFAGFCHWDGTGKVSIDFYRLDDELDFAHLLVHESTHGFLHRFRTPINIPSWANEGLAQWMASKLVPNKRAEDYRRDSARKELKKAQIGNNFFTDKQIPLNMYDVAENLSAYMIAQNPGAYVDFINGVKDGLTVDESLDRKYGVEREKLIASFRQSFLAGK